MEVPLWCVNFILLPFNINNFMSNFLKVIIRKLQLSLEFWCNFSSYQISKKTHFQYSAPYISQLGASPLLKSSHNRQTDTHIDRDHFLKPPCTRLFLKEKKIVQHLMTMSFFFYIIKTLCNFISEDSHSNSMISNLI